MNYDKLNTTLLCRAGSYDKTHLINIREWDLLTGQNYRELTGDYRIAAAHEVTWYPDPAYVVRPFRENELTVLMGEIPDLGRLVAIHKTSKLVLTQEKTKKVTNIKFKLLLGSTVYGEMGVDGKMVAFATVLEDQAISKDNYLVNSGNFPITVGVLKELSGEIRL